MDRQKLDKKYREDAFNRFYSALHSSDIQLGRVRLKKPKLSLEDEVLNIFSQRKQHRNIVLGFVMALVLVVALAFFWLIFWNAKTLLHTQGKTSIVDSRTLQIIAVSFFVQLIMVIRSITRALWDDKNYLNSPLLRRMYHGTPKEDK